MSPARSRWSPSACVVLLGCGASPLAGVLGSVRIVPEVPTAVDALGVELEDLAGAPLAARGLDLSYAWAVDGALVRDLEGPAVPAERTAKGQRWSVEVGVRGTLDVAAAAVEIRNSAPTVFVVLSEGGAFRPLSADVTTDDLDGDEVTWEGAWWLDDLPYEELTGLEIPPGYLLRDQVWGYRVEATDGDVVVRGQAEVTVGNTPPDVLGVEVRPTPPRAGRLLTVSVTALDPDGDPTTQTVRWYADGVEIVDADPRGVRLVAGTEVEVEVEVRDDRGDASTGRSDPVVVLP